MATKLDLRDWVIEALHNLGGGGSVLDVSKEVWRLHGKELQNSGALFFTWQYDIRWAAYSLRKTGKLKPANDKSVRWELA